MKIRFSVLIPAYNIEKYIRQTIDSVLAQSFTDYEIIVIDDGSTDQTPRWLESYGTRIQVIRQSNQGPEAARNKAASLARGEYLAMLDHDDLLLPCALATYDQVIRNFNGPPLIIGCMKFFQRRSPHPGPGPGLAPGGSYKVTGLSVEGCANRPFQQPNRNPEVGIRRGRWLWKQGRCGISPGRLQSYAESRNLRTMHHCSKALHGCLSLSRDECRPECKSGGRRISWLGSL